ncbi:MAG: glycosyltransferase family 2 protein, partial [Microgenomates group bacterium]
MISAVVLIKNEERNIERCLQSLTFCDEIIVIDDYSTDTTVKKIRNWQFEIGNKIKIQVYQKHLNNNFAAQRNFGIEKARGEWILFLDGDEEISEELKKEIKKIFDIRYSILGENVGAFYIKRRDFWWGRELRYGEIMKVRNKGLIRLVRKGSGRWVGKVHEKFEIGNSKLKTRSFKNYINHYPHQTVKEFLKEINFYSTLRAKELFNQGKKT